MDDVDELLAVANRTAWLPVYGPASRSHQLEVIPAYCRAARAILNWTKPKLAEAAGLGLSTVVDFERGHRIVSAEAVQAIRRALESAGVEFTDGNDRA
jgi:Helix-turn-helix